MCFCLRRGGHRVITCQTLLYYMGPFLQRQYTALRTDLSFLSSIRVSVFVVLKTPSGRGRNTVYFGNSNDVVFVYLYVRDTVRI